MEASRKPEWPLSPPRGGASTRPASSSITGPLPIKNSIHFFRKRGNKYIKQKRYWYYEIHNIKGSYMALSSSSCKNWASGKKPRSCRTQATRMLGQPSPPSLRFFELLKANQIPIIPTNTGGKQRKELIKRQQKKTRCCAYPCAPVSCRWVLASPNNQQASREIKMHTHTHTITKKQNITSVLHFIYLQTEPWWKNLHQCKKIK